jgi:hypothetical protein
MEARKMQFEAHAADMAARDAARAQDRQRSEQLRQVEERARQKAGEEKARAEAQKVKVLADAKANVASYTVQNEAALDTLESLKAVDPATRAKIDAAIDQHSLAKREGRSASDLNSIKDLPNFEQVRSAIDAAAGAQSKLSEARESLVAAEAEKLKLTPEQRLPALESEIRGVRPAKSPQSPANTMRPDRAS